MWKTSASAHRGTLKEAAPQETSLPLPTRMVVLMCCLRRPMRHVKLLSMMLWVVPVSTSMWAPVPKIAPTRYMGWQPRIVDCVVPIIMRRLLSTSSAS